MQPDNAPPNLAEDPPGYEHHFGLAESPFALTSNPRFLFESASYHAALKEIAYGLPRREPIIVVTGAIGLAGARPTSRVTMYSASARGVG